MILLSFGAAGLVALRSSTAWRHMQDEVAALERQWRARDFRRDVPYGQPVAGDARPHYEAAMQMALELSRDDQRLVAMLPHGDDRRAAGCEALLAEWQGALAELHAGAMAARCVWPPRDFDGPIANLLSARWLVNVAVLRARSARLAGRTLQAVHDTLGAAQFGADFMRSDLLIEQMIGAAMLAIATKEAWPEPVLLGLDEPALTELALGLQRIDAGLPASVDFRGELLAMGRTIRNEPEDLGVGAWKFAFSQRWMMADAFATMSAVYGDNGDSAADWPQRQRGLRRRLAALQGARNDLVAICAPNLESAERSYREAIAHLRLLRIAVDRHRGNVATALQDPLGVGPLRIESRDGACVVASVGSTPQRPIERIVTR